VTAARSLTPLPPLRRRASAPPARRRASNSPLASPGGPAAPSQGRGAVCIGAAGSGAAGSGATANGTIRVCVGAAGNGAIGAGAAGSGAFGSGAAVNGAHCIQLLLLLMQPRLRRRDPGGDRGGRSASGSAGSRGRSCPASRAAPGGVSRGRRRGRVGARRVASGVDV